MWKQLGQLFYSLQTPAGCAVPTVGTTVLHWETKTASGLDKPEAVGLPIAVTSP